MNVSKIEVRDPHKEGDGLGAFISYAIVSQCVSPGDVVTEATVQRRYRDFLWLREEFTARHPGVIVPPLPEKQLMGRFSREHIDHRRRGLERFLDRVRRHPTLSKSEEFIGFISHSNEDFDALRARLALTKKKTGKEGIVSLLKDLQHKMSVAQEQDAAYDSLKSYVGALEGQLSGVIKNAERLGKRRRALGTALHDFGEAFVQLAFCEAGNMANALRKMGETAEALSNFSSAHADAESAKFLESLDEYIRIANSIKETMKTRDQAYTEYQALAASVDKRRVQLSKLRSQAGKEEKAAQVGEDVRELQVEAEEAHERYESIVAGMREDVERMMHQKLVDFRKILIDFIDLQIEHSERVAAAWEKMIPYIEAIHVDEEDGADEAPRDPIAPAGQREAAGASARVSDDDAGAPAPHGEEVLVDTST